MALIEAGYWQTTYFPKSYWPTDYWVNYGAGVTHEVSGTISAVSSMSGRAMRGGVPSGIDEAVRNEFQFPHVPESVPEDVRRILIELRAVLEQQLIGDFRIGGAIDVDGDIHTRGILHI